MRVFPRKIRRSGALMVESALVLPILFVFLLIVIIVGLGTFLDQQATLWDQASKDVLSMTTLGEYVTNTVRVTITYQWSPGGPVGTITLSSVCEIPLSS